MAKKKKTISSSDNRSEVIGTYKKVVKFNCPVRGMVEQEVEVKLYKGQSAPENRHVDPDVAELLSSEMQELEDAGFHEDSQN